MLKALKEALFVYIIPTQRYN